MTKSKFNTTLLLSIIVFIGISCSQNPRTTVLIEDASKPLTKEVQVENNEDKNVDKLLFHIKGQTDDTAKIGQSYFIYPGKIDTTIRSGDQYSYGYYFVYDPMNVTEGSLEVIIEFVDF